MFLLFLSFLLCLLSKPLLQLWDNINVNVWIAEDQKKFILVTGDVMILR
jgi:hypothetical protein